MTFLRWQTWHVSCESWRISCKTAYISIKMIGSVRVWHNTASFFFFPSVSFSLSTFFVIVSLVHCKAKQSYWHGWNEKKKKKKKKTTNLSKIAALHYSNQVTNLCLPCYISIENITFMHKYTLTAEYTSNASDRKHSCTISLQAKCRGKKWNEKNDQTKYT